MLQNIIFDFDGVIHNTFEFHLAQINAYAPEANFTAEDYRRVHDGNVFKNEHAVESLGKVHWKDYPSFIKEEKLKLRTEAHVAKALAILAEMHDLFLVTSGSNISVLPYLEKNNIDEHFTRMLFREDGLSKVQKLQLLHAQYSATSANSVFVTDTVGDIIEGHEAGLSVVAVSFGFHDAARLQKAAPEALVHSWDELMALFKDSARMESLLV